LAWPYWRQVFYGADKGGLIMNDPAEDLVLRLPREEVERIRARPAEPARLPERPTIHYTQLPDSPIRTEWNCYRRLIGRLLVEGRKRKRAGNRCI
jgi:hypothetical protein